MKYKVQMQKLIIFFLFSSLLFFWACDDEVKIARSALGKAHVIIIGGQSQAVGSADNMELPLEIINYKYQRTFIWETGWDSTQITWPRGERNPHDVQITNGWDNLSIYTKQRFNQGEGTHGIEPYLAFYFEKSFPDDTLYIINFSFGGIPLYEHSSFLDWSPKSDNEMYYYFINKHIEPALKELTDPYLDGIYWAQGETDAQNIDGANSYFTNLSDFFNNIKFDLPSLGDSPKVILQVVKYDSINMPHVDIVREAQQKYCNPIFLNNATLINCDSIPRITGDIHFNSLGYKLIALKLMDIIY
jgi:hypothetical protein